MAAMTTGRTRVEAPAVKPAPGIFDVVTPIELGEGESHQLMGVEYETQCSTIKFVTLDPDSCIATAEKQFDGLGFEQGDVFYIYAGVQCNLFGSTEDEYAAGASERMGAGEQAAVEQFLWSELLPNRTPVNVTPGTGAVTPSAGLGLLEEIMGLGYRGVPTVHAGRRLSVLLAAKGLVKGDKTATGADFINGGGYFGANGPPTPGDPLVPIVAGENEAWMYATGVMTLRRGPVRIHNAVSPETNDRIVLAERGYVPTVDCMVAAVLVTLE